MRNCQNCGKEFQARSYHHTFCCNRCSYKERYRRNPEKYRDRHRNYYAKNKTKLIQYSAEWKARQRKNTPWLEMFSSAKERARDEKLPYNLDHAWASARWTGNCEVSGLPFIIGKGRNMFSPSIDKIRPELGYVQSNCRFVLFSVNTLKYNGTDENMYRIAEAITTRCSLQNEAAALLSLPA